MLSLVSKYAIKSIIYICLKGSVDHPVGIADICEHINVPKPYSSKILQQLVKQGLLHSKKGKGGGFFLDEYQKENSLMPIVTALDGYGAFKGCGMGLDYCSSEQPCPLHDDILRIRAAYAEFLTAQSIEKMAQNIKSGHSYLLR